MLDRPWVKWLAILLAITAMGSGALLGAIYLEKMRLADMIHALTALAGLGWCALGMIKLWHDAPARWSGLIYGALMLVAVGLWMAWRGATAAAMALAGVTAMAVIFLGGLAILRAALGLISSGVTGVARTVIDEAIRMKVAVIFIAAVIVVLPSMPLVLDPRELLQYRVQFFLTWSLTLTSFLLSLMTVFLACRTITSEVARKQIFLTMSKPVGRFGYLAGKWLGIVLLNALLLSVAGAGVYTFARLLGQRQFALARDAYDQIAVEEQVLTARKSIAPKPPPGMDLAQAFKDRLERLQEQSPHLYGQKGAAASPVVAREIMNQVQAGWLALGPGNAQAYVFDGLEAARQSVRTVQLRIKPKSSQAPPDGLVRLAMRVNGRPFALPALADDQSHAIAIPTALIDAKGALVIELANVDIENPSATFPSTVTMGVSDGLSVLYRVGSFERNMAGSMLVLWVRLSFLSMLGLAAGTFLGFPVASLLCLMVYFTAAASGFLDESLTYYAALPSDQTAAGWPWLVALWSNLSDTAGKGDLWGVIKIFVALFGRLFVWMIPSFSSFDPITPLASGLAISQAMVGGALLRVGLAWTGACGLIAWLIWRKRELARVTV